MFRHGHTRVVPLFVTTHEHVGKFNSIILRRHSTHDTILKNCDTTTGSFGRLEAGVTKCNTGRAVELEAVRGPRAGGGGATFEQQQALDPDVSSSLSWVRLSLSLSSSS